MSVTTDDENLSSDRCHPSSASPPGGVLSLKFTEQLPLQKSKRSTGCYISSDRSAIYCSYENIFSTAVYKVLHKVPVTVLLVIVTVPYFLPSTCEYHPDISRPIFLPLLYASERGASLRIPLVL